MQVNELTRRERERLEHRRQMLEAAERVFVREGYAGATVERIAQEADFAVGTLYNFFGSKEKLFDEVLSNLAAEAFELLESRVFKEPDPLAALGALLTVRLTFPLEHRGFFRVFIEAAPEVCVDFSRSLPARCRELHERYMSSVVEILERGSEAGVFRGQAAFYTALCLEGALRDVGMHWLSETVHPTPETVEEVKCILLGMVCRRTENESDKGGCS